MKLFLAVLVVTLALPAGALASPADSHHGWSQLAVQARGTDVAAPDQQGSTAAGSIPPSAPAPAPSASSFDYGDAGIGAAVAILLVTIGSGLSIGVRRRHEHRPSAVTG